MVWDFFGEISFYDEKKLADYCREFIKDGVLKNLDDDEDLDLNCESVLSSLSSYSYHLSHASVSRLFNSQFSPILFLLTTFRLIGQQISTRYNCTLLTSTILKPNSPPYSFFNFPSPPPIDPTILFDSLSVRSGSFFNPKQMVFYLFIYLFVCLIRLIQQSFFLLFYQHLLMIYRLY
jgi:hypothetical protein